MRYRVQINFFYITSKGEISNYVELIYVDNILDLPRELEGIFSDINWEKVTLKEISVFPVIKKN